MSASIRPSGRIRQLLALSCWLSVLRTHFALSPHPAIPNGFHPRRGLLPASMTGAARRKDGSSPLCGSEGHDFRRKTWKTWRSRYNGEECWKAVSHVGTGGPSGGEGLCYNFASRFGKGLWRSLKHYAEFRAKTVSARRIGGAVPDCGSPGVHRVLCKPAEFDCGHYRSRRQHFLGTPERADESNRYLHQ